MKNIFFALSYLLSSFCFGASPQTNTTTGIPIISIVALALFVLFFTVKNKFKGSFRANKTAILVALLTIALLAWPFKFFQSKENKQNSQSEINK
jgi:hypothetical protein